MPRKTPDKRHTAAPKAASARVAPVVAPTAPAQAAAEAAHPVETPVAPVQPATPSPEVIAAIAALNDRDADVARDAATSLGQLANASAVEPLISVLENCNGYFHSVVRAAAAASLGQLKDKRAVDALLRSIHDPIAEPSAESIHALAALGDARALGAFVQVIRNSDGFFLQFVRRAAVLGLARLGSEQAKAELTRIAAEGSENAVIRETAEEALRPAIAKK